MLGRALDLARYALAMPRILRSKIDEIDHLRSRIDLGLEIVGEFEAARASEEYQAVYDKPEPLVTICIGTYNRGRLLEERSVRSALAQTYRNIEVVVVGDHCTDDTAERMARIADPRLRFHNLPVRGPYPEDPEQRWMVAGTFPFNEALRQARGDFITHLDDDDEHLPDRLEKLVAFIKQTRADLVYHPFFVEQPGGRWKLNRAEVYRHNRVTTSSVLYHNWLRRIGWDPEAYAWKEPGDWNRFRKLRYLGIRMERFGEPLLRHYRERSQAGR